MTSISDNILLSLDEFCVLVKYPEHKIKLGSPNDIAEALFKQFVRDRGEKYLEYLQQTDEKKREHFDNIKSVMSLENWKKLAVLFKLNVSHIDSLKKHGIKMEYKGLNP